MLIPTGVSVEDYNDALALEEVTHARVTFPIDNIVFQDEELEQGGIQVSTYMNPSDSMQFGIACCAEAVIHLLNSEKTDSVNFAHEFYLEFGVEINGTINWMKIGHFSGSKPVQTIGSDMIELVAYDKMSRFDREADDFISLLTFPCTLEDIYNRLCEFVVVDNIPGDEIASVMSRQFTNADNFAFASCRDVLAAIAEANGCYAKVTNEGFVQLVWFDDHTSEQTLALDNCFGGNIIKLEKSYSAKWGSLETNRWKDVESVKYSEYDNSSNPFNYSYVRGLWKLESLNKDVVQPDYDPYRNHRLWANAEAVLWSSVESVLWKDFEIRDNDIAGNVYTILDNPFLIYDTDVEIKSHLQFILDRLYNFHLYYVANINMVGNWLVEPGDIVILEIRRDTFIEYPIFNRVIMWNGSCECRYETTGKLTA